MLYNQYDILTLENEKEFVVAHIIPHNKTFYYLLVEVDADENILEGVIIAKEEKIDESYQLVEITEESEMNEIKNMFDELLDDEEDE